MHITRVQWRGWNAALAALMLLMIFGLAGRTHAGPVYKCRDAAGHIAYQDSACAHTQLETRIEIAPAPKPGPAPDYRPASSPRGSQPPSQRVSSHRGVRAGEALSYECRAANGEVFYQHGSCPRSIKDDSAAGRRAGSRRSANTSVAVSATPLPRSEVCRRLAAAGSGARAGHERDDRVSTYERNAGRDPCRRS
jgi:hypothetical protein